MAGQPLRAQESTAVQTTVERVDDTKVTVQITVESERVEEAVEAAASRLAEQVNVPGFRPGKAPRRVLESRVGKDALAQEAAQHALPEFYREAVQAEQLHVAGQPELDVETFEPGQDAVFSATVEIVPEVEPPDIDDLQIPHPDWEVTEEDVTAQLDNLRQRFAELETVSRAADVGDYVKITVTAEHDGQRIEDASGEDMLYHVEDPQQSNSELDRQLVGAEPGNILKFSETLADDFGELAGKEADFTVIVKEAKAQRLPELTDEFVEENTEFDTLAEFDAELRRQLAAHKREQARTDLRSKVVEALADRVEVALPESLVQQELQFRVQRLSSEAEQHGVSPDQYLQMMGDSEDVFSQLDQQARATVKSQLVLDAIAKQMEVEVDRNDLESEVYRQAQRMGRDPQEIAQLMTQEDRIGALISDTRRRKTIDRLLESVQVLGGPPADDADLEEDPEAGARTAAMAAAEATGDDETGEAGEPDTDARGEG
jgi:trigger factor